MMVYLIDYHLYVYIWSFIYGVLLAWNLSEASPVPRIPEYQVCMLSGLLPTAILRMKASIIENEF